MEYGLPFSIDWWLSMGRSHSAKRLELLCIRLLYISMFWVGRLGCFDVRLLLSYKTKYRLLVLLYPTLAPAHALLLDCRLTAVPAAGKVEVDFPKAEHGVRWTRFGEFLQGHGTLLESRPESEYIPCVVSEVTAVTHDVKQFTVSLPEGYHMSVPVGHHVKVKATVEGKLYHCAIYQRHTLDSNVLRYGRSCLLS